MSSLRSDTLTMRVTGVRITVFCSAIVIDVIVHCHTAGALLSQTAENNCPYHRVVGFLILSGQFIITLVAELGIQPLIRSFWTETSAITFSTFSIAVTILLRPPAVATGACVC